jgi:hypothetical protein
MLLPHVVDTVRAQLQGTLGVYTVGFVHELCELLGLREAEFVAAICAARDDSAIAEWIAARCNTSTFGTINQRLLDVGIIERVERGA